MSQATGVAASRTADLGSRTAHLAALGIAALAGFLSLGLMMLPAHAAADVTHYKYWARLVSGDGVAGAYSGQYPETAAIYPPVTMYGYGAAGWAYRQFVDPEFEIGRALESRGLTVLVKLVAVVPHVVLTLVIYWLVSTAHPARVALVASAAYGLNPATLFDTAYWGQPDSAHAMFLLLGLWSVGSEMALAGWVWFGLAAVTKPQAWALLPFVGYVSLRRFGLSRSLLGGAVAGAAALAVCSPYIAAGTFGDLFKLPRMIAETMPVASANAHNVWWLLTNARPDFVLEAELLFDPITYRQVATVLALTLFLFGLWRTDPFASAEGLVAMAAYLAFGWFLVTTRAHENHAFIVLPLLAFAAPSSRFLAVAFVIVSVTSFFNMTLHDFSLSGFRESLFSLDSWVQLQLLNAAVNLVLFWAWTYWVYDQKRVTERGDGRKQRPAPTPLC